MAQLSQDDRDIIEQFPLNDTLEEFRDVLRDAEQSLTSGSTSRHDTSSKSPETTSKEPKTPSKGPEKPRLFTAVLNRLLGVLDVSDAGSNLPSKIGSSALASDLVEIRLRLQKQNLDHRHFHALSRLVINNAPDVDIWSAVFDLTNTLLRVTPPGSIRPSLDCTPVTRSSTVFEGSEQTRDIIEHELFYEINGCTYRGVDGFFDKYFERRDQSRDSRKMSTSMRAQHKRGRWTGFPKPPEQGAVWEWLSRFQERHLSRSRRIFYTTRSTGDLAGSGAKRQLDVLMKQRSNSGEKHNWKDVHVIGELKQSERMLQEKFKSSLLQLTRYARDVFAAQPTRRFVHGFLLCGSLMELWIFDRSGPYSSGPFDIHKEPEMFIQAITGYAMMSDNELGLDVFIDPGGDTGPFITIDEDVTGKENQMQLEDAPFFTQAAVVCRGTNCWRSRDGANVVKFSWTSDRRRAEAELLQIAHDKGVEGIAHLVGYQLITTIDELRSGLTFGSPHPFRVGRTSATTSSQADRGSSFDPMQNLDVSKAPRKRKSRGAQSSRQKRSRANRPKSRLSQQYEAEHASKTSQQQEAKQATKTSLYGLDESTYANRKFGCLAVSPAGRGLHQFESITQLLGVLRDAIKGHRSLLEKGQILHRDISENNIIITDPKETNGFLGILIDEDLAKLLGSERSGARHKTGTRQFMAIGVLRGHFHTYRHDLESFFYVLLWVCGCRAWEKGFRCRWADRPEESRFQRWYKGTFNQIADAKMLHMRVDGLELILHEFPQSFDCVKPLCRSIRSLLFLNKAALNIGIPSDAPGKLYDAIIREYNKAIDLAKAEGK